MFPNFYVRLEQFAEILPGNSAPLSAPFLGLVVNLNVVTQAHRDSKDYDMCLVLAVGDFDGGELCLDEPGIVLPLSCGDFVVFPSCRITHFNLHYEGRRASIVLHTDKEITKWYDGDRNGWANNESFN